VTQPLPIRAIVPAEAAAFIAVLGEAFTSSGSVEQALAYELLTLDFDRTAAAFDGDTIAGTSSAFGFRLPVPGATADCAGITNVAVLPAYRRRGIMSAMITDLLRDSLVRGEPIAALFASESGIYGRFGFGCASEHLAFTIKRGEGRLLPLASLSAGQPPGTGASPSSAAPAVQPADPEKDRADLAAVYAGIAASRPGLFHRDDRWWRARTHDPESEREGTSALRCVIARDDAGPRGYALYRTRPNWGEDGIPAAQLMITELMAADPQATVALWTDLLTRDLVGEVTARLRPVDDPLLHLLADRRRARAQLSDGLWIRLNDVPAALAQRRYACESPTRSAMSGQL